MEFDSIEAQLRIKNNLAGVRLQRRAGRRPCGKRGCSPIGSWRESSLICQNLVAG
jgi:hypothetical protein